MEVASVFSQFYGERQLVGVKVSGGSGGGNSTKGGRWGSKTEKVPTTVTLTLVNQDTMVQNSVPGGPTKTAQGEAEKEKAGEPGAGAACV